jgi:hypothetical protein
MDWLMSIVLLTVGIALVLGIIALIGIPVTRLSQEDMAKLFAKDPDETLIGSWVCNARLSDAQMNEITALILKAMDADRAVEATTQFIKKMTGGMWVGGRLVLTNKRVQFTPNALNRALHRTLPRIALSLADLGPVTTRFGMITKIVDLPTPAGVLSVRLTNSTQVAALIEQARQRAAGTHGFASDLSRDDPGAQRAAS